MKRVLLPLALAAALALAGCGQSGSGDSGFSREDLSLTVEGTAYRCNMDITEVIAHLGEDYGYAEGMSCDYDGLDKTYTYEAAVFYTSPLAAGDLINEIYTRDPSVTTTKGIAVGSTRAQVLAAYGDDYEDDNDRLIYRLEGERATLCFDMEGDAVYAVSLTTLSV